MSDTERWKVSGRRCVVVQTSRLLGHNSNSVRLSQRIAQCLLSELKIAWLLVEEWCRGLLPFSGFLDDRKGGSNELYDVAPANLLVALSYRSQCWTAAI